MRDVVIFGIIFGLVPMMLKRPAIGALVFMWISIMNPHRLAYGPAHDFPFAAMVAGITLISVFKSKEPRKFPASAVTVLLLVFAAWMTFTSFFALSPTIVWMEWNRVIKTLFMVVITMLVVNTEKDLKLMVWILGLSLGFFGLKGGLFTLASGGSYRVLGPDGSYIAENNSLALAFVMTIPIIWFLRTQVHKHWMRLGLTALAILTAISAAGSYSRGALLAGVAMMMFLWLKSRNKVGTGVVLALMVPVVMLAMPEQWFTRMSTIDSYQTDGSALGRFNAWYFAMAVAKSHVLGGGFLVFNPWMFRLYAPNPLDFHVAHSIYFQVLGEHGYIGLAIFVSLIISSWLMASSIIRSVRKVSELKWASDLAAMCQVSMIGYLVGGAFLSLAYYDYFYYVIAALVITRKVVAPQLAALKLGQGAQQREVEPGVPAFAKGGMHAS
ncbi:putative O-glycosylation ligase, exosortase A system-associated [Noviherbaspirillum pedocola]|uniref:O-glycosylation ligase, exosortase A system-associated n=1 Tax=Noviherbaspirillum pedocola TaxID=2801341 RepID=A0A934W4W1_9BURK|nr:putative O-glycosylation ligase, exosortase A system-associated [Noviherbaspirillum pedocola]MBK4734292.1 putative O-glycosylation ligase, exosortase A system-associated [Noviherbaspirillum pedocola]